MVGLDNPLHIAMVLVIVLLLFGSGKISNIMGDVAKGIKAFKQGMKEDDNEPEQPAKTIEGTATTTAKEKDRATST